MYVPAAKKPSAIATRNITWPSRNVEEAARSVARGSNTLSADCCEEDALAVPNGLSDIREILLT